MVLITQVICVVVVVVVVVLITLNALVVHSCHSPFFFPQSSEMICIIKSSGMRPQTNESWGAMYHRTHTPQPDEQRVQNSFLRHRGGNRLAGANSTLDVTVLAD